jgi:hypothetical protein
VPISGLSNAILVSGVMALDDLADVAGVTEIGNQVAATAFATARRQGTWSNACLEKRATLAVRESIASNAGKDGGSPHMFGFTLKNPAKRQNAVAISLTISGCGDARSTGTSCNSASRTMGSIMEVLEARMDTRLQQSSAFPCDNNIITVDLRANVKVLSACKWKCTISGFTDLTATNGAITLSAASLTTSGVTNDAHSFFTGEWAAGSSSSQKKLVVTLGASSSTQLDVNRAYEDAWHRFQFASTNHPSGHAACSLQAQCTLDSATVDNAGTTCVESQVQSTQLASSEVVDSTAELVIAGKSVTGVGTDASDFKVCYVRSPTWKKKTFSQTSTEPCFNDQITVVLTSNVPIFYSTGTCMPKITLTGLSKTGSCTRRPTFAFHKPGQSASIPVDGVSLSAGFQSGTGVFLNPAEQWIAGNVVLTPSTTQSDDVFMQAGQDYLLVFTLINPTAEQSNTVSVTKTEAPAISAQTLQGKFAVDKATIRIVGFSQSSRYPCDSSTVAVSLQSSHTLLTRCNPTITLSGFANTDVSGGFSFFTDAVHGWKTIHTIEGNSAIQEVGASGCDVGGVDEVCQELDTGFSSWMTGNSAGSGLDGKIVFSVGAMGKATGPTASMVVQFQVRNKKESLSAISAPPSQFLTVTGTMASGCTGDSMPFASNTWTAASYEVDCIRLSMDITQSSSAACDPANTITIALTALSALRCPGEKITIEGLGCRETDTGTLILASPVDEGVMETAEFEKEGKIVVQLDGPGLPGSVRNYLDLFEAPNPAVLTFKFIVANPPQSCGISALSVTLGSGALVCSNGITTTGTLKVDDFNFVADKMVIMQSSSTPCTDNVITVKFQTSDTLRMACASQITLMGLMNTQTDAVKASMVATSATIFPLEQVRKILQCVFGCVCVCGHVGFFLLPDFRALSLPRADRNVLGNSGNGAVVAIGWQIDLDPGARSFEADRLFHQADCKEPDQPPPRRGSGSQALSNTGLHAVRSALHFLWASCFVRQGRCF